MSIVKVMGMCSACKKVVGIQFLVGQNATYTAAGSYLPKEGAASSADEDKALAGQFFVASNYVCSGCHKHESLYQCGYCKTFVCYDGKDKRHAVCPQCGKAGDVPAAPRSGAIVRGSAEAVRPDILIALDTSGSMNEHGRLDEVKKAAVNTIISKFEGKSRMGLVTFGESATVVVPLTDKASAVKSHLLACRAYGGTVSPFRCIREDASLDSFRTSANPRYLVIFTDGEWAGRDDGNRSSAQKLRDMGITIIAIGCVGANQEFISAIASEGADIKVNDGNISGGFATAVSIIADGQN